MTVFRALSCHLCIGLQGNLSLNYSLQLVEEVWENPEILTQCFHCVDFLILAKEKRSADRCQQSLIIRSVTCVFCDM